jgi:plasmid stability protein
VASLTVRDIPEAEKKALRVRAARNGRSMEAELRCIIHEAVKSDLDGDEVGLGTAIHRRFAPYGGVDLPEHPPVTPRPPPRFE